MANKKALSLAACCALAAGTAVYRKQNPESCPICTVKKLIARTHVHAVGGKTYDNGVALTPPMGWSSWNTFRGNIDEQLIKDTADAMKKSGLSEAGYKYVNLDDCWHSSLRDENGRLQGDLSTFPNGIKPLVKDLNDMGFKVGIYSSNGTHTCEDLPASLGNERTDAETFADWGIEFFKYDFCHNKRITTKAPAVSKIMLSGEALAEDMVMGPESAELSGTAALLHDKHGAFVGRLGGGKGIAEFDIKDIPCGGDYVLTIVFRKNGSAQKHLEVKVNHADSYSIDTPPTRAWSVEGKIQTVIRLAEGDNVIQLFNPIGSRMDSAAAQYTNMGKELKRAAKLYAEKHGTEEKPIVFSICEWGWNMPWKWGSGAGNLWRTTPDIMPTWPSVLAIYEVNVRLYNHSCIGCWNDPDMLEVGNGKLTVEENKAHFTLWAMMAAPLILGNDIRKFIGPDGKADKDNKVLQIITNKDIIDIDQDPKGVQCRRLKTDIISDILVKPLAGAETAVCFFNKSGRAREMSVSLADVVNQSYVDMPLSSKYECKNLWTKETFTAGAAISASVAPHGVTIFRIKAI